MLYRVHCLRCYNTTVVDLGPMSWAHCPQCGAGRQYLRKMEPYGVPPRPHPTDDPFERARRMQ